MTPHSILITGATGFLGRAVAKHLDSDGRATVMASRGGGTPLSHGVWRAIGEIDGSTDWADALSGVEAVVHTAARVHVMNDSASDPLEAYRRVNVEGTLNLARQAARAGVRRFVFISSIKVNGESTGKDECFHADDVPQPCDPYGVSKYEAEQGLLALAESCAMELVIIRPVLVYGPGVKANFLQLMKLLKKGLPLPLGSVNNARSLVSLDNLVDFIRVCIDHPAAANQIFLISDGHDLSTSELARRLLRALGSRSWLVPFPGFLLLSGAKLLGRESTVQRLLGSLRVDIQKNKALLDWVPPVSVDQGLNRTVAHFLMTEIK